MIGQYSIWDYQSKKKRPCDYRFERYIGQKVWLSITSGKFVGEIVEIEAYYTIVKVKGHYSLYAGTPTTIYPIEMKGGD